MNNPWVVLFLRWALMWSRSTRDLGAMPRQGISDGAIIELPPALLHFVKFTM
jgi:hypothetical protein